MAPDQGKSKPNLVQMQSALNKTLDLIGDGAKESLLFHLQNYHDISVDGSKTFTERRLETALSPLFGRGTAVLMRRFKYELHKNGSSGQRKIEA